MFTILMHEAFADWLSSLKDRIAKARIAARIRSAKEGNLGDCKPVGDGVSEMRINTGPGYRVYFVRRGEKVYLLLCGGDKASQDRDIKRAKALLEDLDHGENH